MGLNSMLHRQGLVESNAQAATICNAAKIAQDKQLRLSVATPLLAALIQGEANNNTAILMLTAGRRTSDTLSSIQGSLSSCNTPIEAVRSALAYADLLIEETRKG